MRARWISFAAGLWLILAPLVLGYPGVAAVLHEVALGLLVCVGTLAAVEWRRARFANLLSGAWLLLAARLVRWDSLLVTTNEIACGVLVIGLALVPGGKVAGARTPAKIPV